MGLSTISMDGDQQSVRLATYCPHRRRILRDGDDPRWKGGLQ